MIYLIITNLLTLVVLYFFVKSYLLHKDRHRTFDRLMDHVNVGYYKYRYRDGVILEANRGFLRILELDLPVKDIIGRSLGELFIYLEAEGSVREVLKQRGEIRDYEYRFRTLKGREKTVIHNSYMEKAGDKRDDIIVALIEDVTKERVSYKKMKESQERYVKLFRNAGDMVIICRFNDLVIEEVNPVAQILTGYSMEELAGRGFEELFHPSKKNRMEDVREDLLFRGAANLETVIVCKNGSYKEVIMTFSMFEIKDDRKVLAMVKDVSDLVKEKEEQARRKKEMEEFWRSSIEREERIKDLRLELDRVKKQLNALKEKR